MTEQKILKLVLSEAAYEVTGTPEKEFEIRKKSKWIESRLFDKQGNKREYDLIEFQKGYKKNAEKKQFALECIYQMITPFEYNFSNGLKFSAETGDYLICFSL